jgi:tetratricopeptide (TPR) repeat protein
MSTADQPASGPQESRIPDSMPGEPRRPVRHRRMIVGGGALLLLIVAGIIVAICFGNWKPTERIPELPEIPTVTLTGADPAVSKMVREARALVEQSPQIGVGWGQYGLVLHAHGFADAAHICYDTAARLEPKNSLWPYLQGFLYHDGPGGPTAALPRFELAASLSPPDSIAHVRVANSLLELGRLDEAERQFGKVLTVKKDDPQAQLGLGRLAVARRRYRDSLPYLLPASEHPSVQNAACTLLAIVYDRLGERASAERTRQKLAKLPPDQLRPDDPVLLLNKYAVGFNVELAKAERLRDEKRYKEMMDVLEATVHRYPDSFEAWSALRNACEMTGNLAGAERAARKNVQLGPKNPDAWLKLATVLISQHRYKNALDSVQKSIALNPQQTQAYLLLAECRKGLGDAAGAAEAYKLAGVEAAPPRGSTPPESEPKIPAALEKNVSVMTFYYVDPRPEKAKQMLVELISPKNLDDPWYKDRGIVLELMAANLGDAGFGQEELVRFYESQFSSAPEGGKRMIIQALRTCGDKTTLQVVEKWLEDRENSGIKAELTALKAHLSNPDRKRIRDAAVKEPVDLDYLWGDFFATGDYAPISRILDVFDLPTDPASSELQQAAQFSAITNFQQHPKLVEIVKRNLDARRNGSKAAIKAMFKELEKSAEERKK